MQAERKRNGANPRSGVGVLLAAVSIVAMVGVLALCFDLARIYIAKNELQTYADAATLAATAELDGTVEGVERARMVGLNWPIKWQFGKEEVPLPAVYFSQYQNGPWFEFPPDPEGVSFAHVVVEGPVKLYFAPAFAITGAPDGADGGTVAAAKSAAASGPGGQEDPPSRYESLKSATVTGRAAGGQLRQTRIPQGLLPYSPNAHLDGRPPVLNPNTGEPDPFNWVLGRRYTFRWPPPGHQKQHDWCEGDEDMPSSFPPNRASSERGFIDIGDNGQNGSGGSAFIRLAILNGDQGHSLQVGQQIVNVTGGRETEVDALHERILRDTDSESANYSAYLSRGTGNGQRLVYMPVNNPYAGDPIVEFAAFFLPPVGEVCGNGNNRPCCAEYVGAGLLGSNHLSANPEPGVYATQLVD